MDGTSSTDHNAAPRDLLLYHNGHAYSLLAEPQGGCYRAQKLGTRENYRAFLDNIVRDPAMRHRLWLQALYWAAYFGEGVSLGQACVIAFKIYPQLGLCYFGSHYCR